VAWTGGQGGRLRVHGASPHRRGTLGGDGGVNPRLGHAIIGEVAGDVVVGGAMAP
jgi:hypothetical protein